MTDLRDGIARASEAKNRAFDPDDGLELLIESRSKLFADTDDDVDPRWQESVRQFNEAAEAELNQRCYAHHRNMCELHTKLVDEHKAKAERFANVKPPVEAGPANVRADKGGGGR